MYYAVVSLVTFVVQTSMSRVVLEKLGLAFTAATPSIALLDRRYRSTGRSGLRRRALSPAAPNRCSAARCSAPATRCSTRRFRLPRSVPRNRSSMSASIASATPSEAVRSASSCCSRHRVQYFAIVALTLLCSAATVVVASRLSRGYIQTLERNLRDRAVELDLSEVDDLTTRTTMHADAVALDSLAPHHGKVGRGRSRQGNRQRRT